MLFPSEHQVVVEESRVEVLCETVVVVVWKDTQCQGTWQRFQAGPSVGQLEERMFLTVENVAEAVKQMEDPVNDPWVRCGTDGLQLLNGLVVGWMDR